MKYKTAERVQRGKPERRLAWNHKESCALRGFQGFVNTRVDLEDTVQLRDLEKLEDLFSQSHQVQNSTAVSHPTLSDEQGTQSTAVTEIDLREINHELAEFWTAEDEKFTFQLGGDGGVQLPLFQLKDRCGAVLPYLEIHRSSVHSKHCQTIEKVIIDCFRTARCVCSQLEVVKGVGKFFCNANAHLRSGFPTEKSRGKVQLNIEVDSHVEVFSLDAMSEMMFWEEERVEVFLTDSDDFTEIHIA
jgi:hypothetical protein